MHEYGVLTEGGGGTGGHFNPLSAQHGCYRPELPRDTSRKVGDLGNVENGEYVSVENTLIKLDGGVQSVLGRSVVLHLHEDNCAPIEGGPLSFPHYQNISLHVAVPSLDTYENKRASSPPSPSPPPTSVLKFCCCVYPFPSISSSSS